MKRVSTTTMEITADAHSIAELCDVPEGFRLDEVLMLGKDAVKFKFYQTNVEEQ